MESAVTGAAGQLAGRPLEEWNAAYVKVENYFHALRVRNKALLGQLVSACSTAPCAARPPSRAAPHRTRRREMDRLVIEWFAAVLQESPANAIKC